VQPPIYQRQTAAYGGIWLHEPETNQGRRSVPELGFPWGQVLGSNQRRLSRRFWRQPSMRILRPASQEPTPPGDAPG
jgi:hypothetical protein